MRRLPEKAGYWQSRVEAKHISTSYIERQNLTMWMHVRRITRLTNGFSKKLENHIAAVSLHFMYYNFVRIHQTLEVTPAMAAGVTDRLWEVSDIVKLVDDYREQRIVEGRENARKAIERSLQSLGFSIGPVDLAACQELFNKQKQCLAFRSGLRYPHFRGFCERSSNPHALC